MADFIELGVFVTLLVVGYFAGSMIERQHYASIRRREEEYRDVLAFMVRFPFDRTTRQRAFLVHGTVVVSADYFKTFVAGLRNLFGGRFRSYETLMERARRDAGTRRRQPVAAGSATRRLAPARRRPGPVAALTCAWRTGRRPRASTPRPRTR